jgi:hypothetical protein
MERGTDRIHISGEPPEANEGDPFVELSIDREIIEQVAATHGFESERLAQTLRKLEQTIDVGTLFTGFDPIPLGTDGDGHLAVVADGSTFWDALAERHGLTSLGREAVMSAHDTQTREYASSTPRDEGVGVLVSCPEFPSSVVSYIQKLVNQPVLTGRQATVWALDHYALSPSTIADILEISTLLVRSELSGVDRETRRMSDAAQILDSPAREITRLNPGPESSEWLGLDWSPWLNLNDRQTLLSALPRESGLYRVHHTGWPGILYIGESGSEGGLRDRVGHGLAVGIGDHEPPQAGNHNATEALWHIDETFQGRLEVSAATPPSAANKQYRRALEATLIAVARREMDRTPDVLLNRDPIGDTDGGTLAEGRADLPVKNNSFTVPDWRSWRMVANADWMGYKWTDPRQLSERGQLTDLDTCLVRVWKPNPRESSSEQLLTLVGTSEAPISRLFNLQKDYDSEMLFSVTEPIGFSANGLDRSRELEEARYDLVGAHYLATGHPPRDQF